MSRIRIVTAEGEYFAELDDSDISNAIWLFLPFKTEANMLGGEIYFELPISPYVPKENRVTVLEECDVAWWPGPNALCFFFGPTPLSGEDGKPVSPFPVVKIGKLENWKGLENTGDRRRILMEKAF